MTRAVVGGLVLTALALSGSCAAHAAAPQSPEASVPAGFDCGKAARAAERFICANAALRWQDLALSRSYRAARDVHTQTAAVTIQRDWLRERDRRCVGDRTFAELTAPASQSRDQVYACLMTVYLERRRELGDSISPPIAVRDVIEIDLSPIARARPELIEDGQVQIAATRLSPDGGHLAILLPSQEIDLPDQLWLYRVADRKLVAATPPPDHQRLHPADAVAAITDLAWRGDKVFVRVALWGGDGDSHKDATAIFAATVESGRRLRKAPDDIERRMQSIGGGLTVGEDELPDDDGAIEPVHGNSAFLVWAADRGHGAIDLRMRPRSPGAASYLIAWGGWELAQILVDAPRSRIVYPADTGIALFDMARRGERRIAGTSRGDQPYAVSADLGVVLWSTRNHCGDEFLAATQTGAPERFCLATTASAVIGPTYRTER